MVGGEIHLRVVCTRKEGPNAGPARLAGTEACARLVPGVQALKGAVRPRDDAPWRVHALFPPRHPVHTQWAKHARQAATVGAGCGRRARSCRFDGRPSAPAGERPDGHNVVGAWPRRARTPADRPLRRRGRRPGRLVAARARRHQPSRLARAQAALGDDGVRAGAADQQLGCTHKRARAPPPAPAAAACRAPSRAGTLPPRRARLVPALCPPPFFLARVSQS